MLIHIIQALSLTLTTPPATPTSTPPPVLESGEQPTYPSILLVENQIHPQISLSYWKTGSDNPVVLEGSRPYSADAFRTHFGENVEAFVSVGGTRISKSAGHPKGSIIKVGFYKQDSTKPWFPHLDTSKPITVTMAGVRFNQPVTPQTDTIFQHCKYAPEDLESCGLPGSARECFNIASTTDDLNGRTELGLDTRMGAYAIANQSTDPASPDQSESSANQSLAQVASSNIDPRTVEFSLSFPYPHLRNLQDPWKSDLPGTFLEPVHFHIEMEVLPEGTEPIDWVARKRNAAVLQDRLDLEGPISVTGSAFPPEVSPAADAQPREVRDFDEPFSPTQTSPEQIRQEEQAQQDSTNQDSDEQDQADSETPPIS